MPAKLSVGLSRKQGLPDYGSVGASCYLEIELPADILSGAGTPFQRQAEMVFEACRLAVDDELARHSKQRRDVLVHDSSPREPQALRLATPKQVRAIERMALSQGMHPSDWLHERIGSAPLHSLSMEEASGLIDELQQFKAPHRQRAA